MLQLQATDLDIGINGAVRYMIVEGDENEDFRVDSHLGHLYIHKRLDYERKKNYVLRIEARDMGTPYRHDNATVSIEIRDVNDVAPRFINVPYPVYVREGLTDMPVHIADLTALDEDTGRGGRIQYSIMNSDTRLFNIYGGELTARNTLDREARDRYDLVIQASDMGK